ncbi:MAG: IPT/TIG domain-containing protein [Planctomycetes bacterium]|nr:IPT/TIG domain-containing protein [Planctomycetota bacterium]
MNRRRVLRAEGLVVAWLLAFGATPVGAATPSTSPSDPATIRMLLDVDRVSIQTLAVSADPSTGILETSIQVEAGVQLDLILERHSNRADDFRVWVDIGSGTVVEVPPPPVTTYRGIVVGHPMDRVRASFHDGALHALIISPGGSWAVQPTSEVLASAPNSEYAVYPTDAWLGTGAACGVGAGFVGSSPGGGATPAGPAGPVIAEIALEADFEYYQACGSSVTNTILDLEDILNSVEGIYEVQLGILYEVGPILVRTVPLYTSTVAGNRLSEFIANWSSPPESSIARDVAHLFTGQPLQAGILGIALAGTVCTASAYALSVDKEPSSYAGRVAVPAHELGHNWGAGHCNGAPDCQIMCASLGGCGPITEFGSDALAAISAFRDTRPCLTPDLSIALPLLESWESLVVDTSRWTFLSGAGVTSLADAEPTYPYSLTLNASALGGDEIRSARILLAGAIDPTLRFYHRSVGVAAGGGLIVEFRDANLDWVILDTLTSNGTDPDQFTVATYSLPAAAAHDDFRLRLRADVDLPTEQWFVDDIAITDGPPPPLPAPTIDSISPATGPVAGGTPVSILGSGFLPDANVTLGGSPLADFVYVDHFTILGVTPAAMGSGSVNVDIAQGGSIGTLTGGFTYADSSVSLSSVQTGPGATVEIVAFATNDVPLAGFSLACSFDGMWIDVQDVTVAGTDVDGAEFVVPNTSNAPGDSWWTLGVVLDLSPPLDTLLPVGSQHSIASITYAVSASAPTGTVIPLEIASGVGNPPVDIVFSIEGGSSAIPSAVDGAIQIGEPVFVRGDGNGDGAIDIADPVANLAYQFQLGPANCLDAFDTNDDGSIDIADPVYNLNYLFSMGAEPPQPFPAPGVDPTPDGLGCLP